MMGALPAPTASTMVVCAAVFLHCHRVVKPASRASSIPETMTPQHGCNVVGD
jgi:hypothetical protein